MRLKKWHFCYLNAVRRGARRLTGCVLEPRISMCVLDQPPADNAGRSWQCLVVLSHHPVRKETQSGPPLPDLLNPECCFERWPVNLKHSKRTPVSSGLFATNLPVSNKEDAFGANQSLVVRSVTGHSAIRPTFSYLNMPSSRRVAEIAVGGRSQVSRIAFRTKANAESPATHWCFVVLRAGNKCAWP